MRKSAALRTAAVSPAEAEAIAPPLPSPADETPSSKLLLGITIAGMLAIPLFMYAGLESFRYPKELLLRAEAIILVALAASWWALGRLSVDRKALLRTPWAIWLLSSIGWCVLTTLTASNRLVSLQSLAYIAAMSAVFVATLLAARGRGIWMAAVPLLPAVINVIVLLMQQGGRTLFELTSRDPRMRQTALIGNPNDVGSYLMIASLAATALAVSSRRWRWYVAPVALVLIGGTFVSATLTAIGALLVGLTVLAALRSWKLVAAAVILLALTAFAAVRTVPPLKARFERAEIALAAKDYDTLLSYRFTGFATAWMMAREHPLTGVGPGTYAWNYMEYRDKAETRYPGVRTSHARIYMFGEAHNDHLQVLAQTGVPGYVLFAAALVLLAMLSFGRGAPGSDGTRFSRALGLPLAAAFAVLALAQFPLELTSVLHTAITYSALALAWSGRP